MIKYLFKFLFLSFIVFISCEDVEVAYPGNNQDLEPKPPNIFTPKPVTKAPPTPRPLIFKNFLLSIVLTSVY